METKKRLVKGSEEAKKYMSDLRAKRGNKSGGSNTPPAAPCSCSPSNDEPTETIKKNKSKKNNKIIVDFI